MEQPCDMLQPLEELRLTLTAQTGINFSGVLASRLLIAQQKFFKRFKSLSAPQISNLLQKDRKLFDQVINEVTIPETYFFREAVQFTFVRDHVIPTFKRKYGFRRPFKVWCAGCATGEEAYSLAILLRESGLSGHSIIMATDICRQSLEIAKQGIYKNWAFRADGHKAKCLYTTPVEGSYKLHSAIRDSVDFRFLNLVSDEPLFFVDEFDLIFCRNVLIYFTPSVVSAVVKRIVNSLCEDGWLVTASSDPSLSEHSGLKTWVTDNGVFYQKSTVAACIVPPFTETWPPFSADAQASADQNEAIAIAAPDPGEKIAIPVTIVEAFADGEAQELAAIKLLADRDAAKASAVCSEALERYPLSPGLLFIYAIIQIDLDNYPEAEKTLRNMLYLDNQQPIAYWTLSKVLHRCHDHAGAARSLRNAQQILKGYPKDAIVPLGENITAEQLLRLISNELITI